MMKRIVVGMKLHLIFLLSLSVILCPAQTVTKEDLSEKKTRTSYGLGANYGKVLQEQGIEVDPAVFLQGLTDGLAREALLSDQELQSLLQGLQNEIRARRQAARAKTSSANLTKGQEFLAANKSKEGVVTLPSGLQYKVLTTGDGPKPSAGDQVSVHYRGTLIDGTEFDSSYGRGRPANFGVTGVIRGWTEALQLMNVGSKWQLFIPSDLAYGAQGTGTTIGPNETLIFEVELLAITTPKPKAAANKPAITSDIIKVPSAEEMKKGAKIEVIKADEVDEYIEKQKKLEQEKAKSGTTVESDKN